jgi:hypothetical protein
LVNLIAGLRRHEVEEAIGLLLDYIDNQVSLNRTHPVDEAASRLLSEVGAKLSDYHFALDSRQHGGAAANALASQLETVLARPWAPGQEAKKRGRAS